MISLKINMFSEAVLKITCWIILNIKGLIWYDVLSFL